MMGSKRALTGKSGGKHCIAMHGVVCIYIFLPYVCIPESTQKILRP